MAGEGLVGEEAVDVQEGEEEELGWELVREEEGEVVEHRVVGLRVGWA